MLSPLLFVSFTAAVAMPSGSSSQVPLWDGQVPTVLRVPITLGVMSRCPDAHACEAVFDNVLRRVGHDKVNIELTFVAKMNETEPVYGVNCLHGEQECAGNVQELCMAKHRPNSKDWWPFVQCLNRGGYENVGLLNLAKGCAKTVGLDWKSDGVAECVEGEEGPSLLRASVTRTREMDITKSCTIVINGQVRCIRDGEWKNCEEGHTPGDFERIIEREFRKLNPGGEH